MITKTSRRGSLLICGGLGLVLSLTSFGVAAPPEADTNSPATIPTKTPTAIPTSASPTPTTANPPAETATPPASPAPATPATPAPAAAAKPEVPTDPLLAQVEEAIKVTSRRYLDGGTHTPWQMVHGLLALRQDFQIKVDGKKVSGLEWISNGPAYRGQPWFEKTQFGGRAQPFNGTPYVFEGHPNQFIGYMSLCNLPLDHKFKTTGEETITVADIIKNAQMEVREGEDNTWTLWALAHYLGPDAQWMNRYNQPWSVERLVQLENYSVVTRAPCGGCHGLFALAYARNGKIQSGKPLTGVWIEADQKVKRHIAEAKSWQNSNGFFSSNHFKGPGYTNDFSLRVSSTGHILEFLMGALTQKELQEEWIRRAVTALSQDLLDHRKDPAECGGLYHAVDSLVIFRDRMKPPAVVKKDEKPAKDDKAAAAPEQRSTAKPAPVDPNEPKPLKETSALPLIEPGTPGTQN